MATLGEYLGAGSGTTKLLLHLNGNSTDSSGNSNNGTDTSITYSQANGKFGQGAGFNGSSSKITTALAIPSSSMIISFWVKPNGFAADYMLVTKDKVTSTRCLSFFINTTSGIVGCYIWNNSNTMYIVGSAALTNAVWSNIIVIWNTSTNKMTAYTNGVLSQEIDITGTPQNTADGFWIGAREYATFNYMNGSIDEVIIENVAWTPQQVQKYFTACKGRYGII